MQGRSISDVCCGLQYTPGGQESIFEGVTIAKMMPQFLKQQLFTSQRSSAWQQHLENRIIAEKPGEMTLSLQAAELTMKLYNDLLEEVITPFCIKLRRGEDSVYQSGETGGIRRLL